MYRIVYLTDYGRGSTELRWVIEKDNNIIYVVTSQHNLSTKYDTLADTVCMLGRVREQIAKSTRNSFDHSAYVERYVNNEWVINSLHDAITVLEDM